MVSEEATSAGAGTETPQRKVQVVRMSWTGEGLVFRGGQPGGHEVTLDGDTRQAASPTQLLLISLAGCMAADVRLILEKSRVPVEELEVEVEGTRAATDPRRFEEIRMVYRVRGPTEEHVPRLERAVQLSRDTYCSVLHTLRQDLDVEIEIQRI